MALSIAIKSKRDYDKGQEIIADVTFDNAYPWRGELLKATDLRFRSGLELNDVRIQPVDGRAIQFVPDPTLKDRGKLRVMGEPGDDFLLNRPGLAIGTVSAAEVKISNPFTKVVGGAIAEVAAAEVGFTATTHDITADATKVQEAIYLLSVDVAGTVSITKGATADEDAAVPPALPAGQAPVGYVLIKVAAGATDFDATTDDLDAAHLTTTFFDADGEALQGADLSDLTVRVIASGR